MPLLGTKGAASARGFGFTSGIALAPEYESHIVVIAGGGGTGGGGGGAGNLTYVGGSGAAGIVQVKYSPSS